MPERSAGVHEALPRAAKRARPVRPTGPGLRQIIADRKEISAITRERATSPLVVARFYAGATPGKYLIILLALMIACGSTGIYSSSVLNDRSQSLESLINRTEPRAEAAEVLYSSLSVADAAANSAFISGGRESPELRQRYADAIATASTALIVAADGGSRRGADVDDLNTIATSLPVYTGIIETARTNNRLGNPVGSAYLGQASSLMQSTILPSAQRLYAQRSAAITEPQRTLTVPPWGVYVALMTTLAMLLGCGRYLARRTRRQFNIGLLVAVAALLVGSLWLLVSGLTSVAAANTAKDAGADPLHTLTSMRILTQQARSAETLSLVRRADPGTLQASYDESIHAIDAMSGSLRDRSGAPANEAIDVQLQQVDAALIRWRQAHDAAFGRLANGDFNGARSLINDPGQDSAAAGYNDVNAALLDAIDNTRTTFRDNIYTAQQVLGYTGQGILVLCLAAALAVLGGVLPRIREYR